MKFIRKLLGLGPTESQKAMDKVHSMIHEASYQLSQGNITSVKQLLYQADMLSHDYC